MRAKNFCIAAASLVLTALCLKAVPSSATDWQEVFLNKDMAEGCIVFNKDEAVWKDNFGIDLSHVRDGVVTVSCRSGKPLKLLSSMNGKTASYSIRSDGTPFTMPLNLGNGAYEVSVMEHVEGISYAHAFTVDARLADMIYPSKVLDHVPPYSCTNGYVPYKEDSFCVKEANRLAKETMSKAEFIESVESYVREHIEYDDSYVPGVLADHEINPDKTLVDGKGICLDFASLTAAMLRSQGVPARLVFGHVLIKSPLTGYETSEYHAWNDAYIDGGWARLDACLSGDNITYQPEQYF